MGLLRQDDRRRRVSRARADEAQDAEREADAAPARHPRPGRLLRDREGRARRGGDPRVPRLVEIGRAQERGRAQAARLSLDTGRGGWLRARLLATTRSARARATSKFLVSV